MELRLFPLRSVVFPGMAVPINVFEPRYLQLVVECQRDDEPFGIALIREGPEVGGFAVPFDVGTTVRIERTEPGPINAIALLGRGERRFRVEALHHDRPYLWADADVIEEPPGEATDELQTRGREQLHSFWRLRERVRPDYQRPPGGAPDGTGPLADAICATGAGEPEQRQRLLETLDPAERLARAIEMFDPVLTDLHQSLDDALRVRRWREPGGLN